MILVTVQDSTRWPGVCETVWRVAITTTFTFTGGCSHCLTAWWDEGSKQDDDVLRKGVQKRTHRWWWWCWLEWCQDLWWWFSHRNGGRIHESYHGSFIDNPASSSQVIGEQGGRTMVGVVLWLRMIVLVMIIFLIMMMIMMWIFWILVGGIELN